MKSHRTKWTQAGLVLTGFLFIAACSKPGDKAAQSPDRPPAAHSPAHAADRDTTNSHEPAESDSPYELQFIDTMTRHHRDAIEMGQLAAARAHHPELRECSAKLVTGQERQIRLMAEWRDQWYAGKPDAENRRLRGMSILNKADLDSLSGNEFDLKFIDMMIPHDEGGIVMAREAFGKVSRGEIKALSQQIMDMQQKDIKMLSECRAKWGDRQ